MFICPESSDSIFGENKEWVIIISMSRNNYSFKSADG